MTKAQPTPSEANDASHESVAFVPRRGRPTKQQIEAIEKTILRIAREFFLRDGYANTAMDAIAYEMSISKGTLYSRYPSKSDLFTAVAVDRLTYWRSISHDDFGDAVDPLTCLRKFGKALLSRMQQAEVAAFDHLIMSEALRFPELAISFNRDGYGHAIDLLAENLKRMAKPTKDPTSVATMFIDGLMGWWRRESIVRPLSPDEISRQVERHAEVIMGGYEVW